MKQVITSHIFMTVVAVICLWFSFIPTAHDFATLKHHLDFGGIKILINSVHDEHWDIGYYVAKECPEDRHAQTKELEKAITLALQTWLQPLREIDTKAPIVNEFRFHQLPLITLEVLQDPDWAHLDLGVNDTCEGGRSAAGMLPNLPPRVLMRKQGVAGNIDKRYISTLIHEIGHTFGLGDLYVERPMEPSVTKGGLDGTVGTQPAAVMSMHLYDLTPSYISEDDINGIIWLYRVTYDDLDPADCFYPDYVFEADPKGCVPKFPLIFEIRQGHETFTLDILKDDENIDVNAQDDTGLTALHYAVSGRHRRVVEALLAYETINVNLTDARGQTPLHYAISKGYTSAMELLLAHDDIFVHVKDNTGQTPVSLAREMDDTELADRLLRHPNYSLHIEPKQKLVTTWASLKRR